MSNVESGPVTAERIEAIERAVVEAAGANDDQRILDEIGPLERAQSEQPEAAKSLLRLVAGRYVDVEHGARLLDEIVRSHGDDIDILSLVGGAMQGARDLEFLNAAPPQHELFLDVVDRLAANVDSMRGTAAEPALLIGLSTAARMVARQRDQLAEQSYRRLVELEPERNSHHYNLGLFMKTRGRFDEGVAANREAARLSPRPIEAYEWNLGICATGAGEGELALEVWKRQGQKIEMGRFDLPEGGYPECKVRLAERPLAERDADNDDPGAEETIWIERLSPCHGIVRSVLVRDLGVNYGDVVLFDGAPITYHKYGDREVPVFPQLSTLVRQNYRFYDFAGTQATGGQLEDLSDELPADAILYSHSEHYREICTACWSDPDLDHENHEAEEKHVVTGRIAAPPDIDPRQLLDALDAALAGQPDCRLYTPALCAAAGETERADVEERRFGLIGRN